MRAEQVAEQVAREVRPYLEAGVPVGPHLADQLLLPIAMAKGGAFRTTALTGHARTQLALLREVMGTAFELREERGGGVEVGVSSAA